MKTFELTGDALDWAVAKCVQPGAEGFEAYYNHRVATLSGFTFHPSTDWAQGGPIIEREKIAIDWDYDCWNASIDGHPAYYSASTPLIAAMRCYVASKLGDEVEIPEELK